MIGVVLKDSLQGSTDDLANEFIKNLNNTDVIISTNYDIVIDNALLGKGNTNYGVQLRRNAFPVEYADGIRRGGNLLGPLLNQGPIKLLKIHGSLNWLYCSKRDELDVTLGQKGAANYIGKDYSLVCGSSGCTAKYDPLIVTQQSLRYMRTRL